MSGRTVLGGTFDHLHVGHEALLRVAVGLGHPVSIGLTTERYLAGHPKPNPARLQPYATRRRALRRWLSARYPSRRWSIVPISDPFGGSVEDGVAVLVVSVDTVAGGRAVNAERRRLGRRPVPVRVVPLVLADDLEPVSSRRIRAGEVDPFGRRLAPITVGLALDSRDDRVAAERGIRRAFALARVTVRPVRFPQGASSRPDALRRAVRRAIRGNDFAVALARRPGTQRRIALASPGLELPPVTLAAPSRGALADAVARWIGRSATAKPFSSGRR